LNPRVRVGSESRRERSLWFAGCYYVASL